MTGSEWHVVVVDVLRMKACIWNLDGQDLKKQQLATEEFKIIIKFKAGQDISSVSPVLLTSGLRNVLGDIEMAKVLRDGSLLVKCKNADQKSKVLKLQTVCKKETVEKKTIGDSSGIGGMISGIPLEEKLEELKGMITGGTVTGIRRLQAFRDGEKKDSPSVLLEFKDEVLPEKVMVGYMSFRVRAYVPPPIRCFKCQRYGHIASVCKGKQRCGRCGGEHAYGECGSNSTIKCCNCGGDHTAAYGGCIRRKQAVEIQQVRTEQKVTYAEAVKIVDSGKRKEGLSQSVM